MYTFCSFFQLLKYSKKNSYFRDLIESDPDCIASSN